MLHPWMSNNILPPKSYYLKHMSSSWDVRRSYLLGVSRRRHRWELTCRRRLGCGQSANQESASQKSLTRKFWGIPCGPTLKIKSLFASHPLKSRVLVCELAVLLGGDRIKASHITTGVCEHSTPFMRAYALQNSNNSSPAPDLVLIKRIIQRVCFSSFIYFHRHHCQPPTSNLQPPTSNLSEGLTCQLLLWV